MTDFQIVSAGLEKNGLLQKLKDAGYTGDKTEQSIFDTYNTNQVGSSSEKLDIDEQAAMLKGLGMSGISEDGKVKIDNKDYEYEFDSNGKVLKRKSKTTVRNEEKDVEQTYKAQGIYVSLDDSWRDKREVAGKITGDEEGYKDIKDNTQYKTAVQVLDKLLELEDIQLEPGKYDALLQKFIRFNPSMFDSNGQVLLDADWSKLDFPEKSQIENGTAMTSSTQSQSNGVDNRNIPSSMTVDYAKLNEANKNEDGVKIYNEAKIKERIEKANKTLQDLKNKKKISSVTNYGRQTDGLYSTVIVFNDERQIRIKYDINKNIQKIEISTNKDDKHYDTIITKDNKINLEMDDDGSFDIESQDGTIDFNQVKSMIPKYILDQTKTGTEVDYDKVNEKIGDYDKETVKSQIENSKSVLSNLVSSDKIESISNPVSDSSSCKKRITIKMKDKSSIIVYYDVNKKDIVDIRVTNKGFTVTFDDNGNISYTQTKSNKGFYAEEAIDFKEIKKLIPASIKDKFK